MGEFLSCYFWWILLGLLLGFLLFWLYDKLFRRDGEDLLTAKDQEIATLKSQYQSVRSELDVANSKLGEVEKSGEDLGLAAKFGFVPFKNGEDELTIIEGIGPKISSILKSRGIKTFAAVASSEVEALQTILDESGAAFKLAKPGSWPKQAQMCVEKKWEELKQYQDRLINGVEFDD